MVRFLSEKLGDSRIKGRRARFESLESRLLLEVGRGISALELDAVVAEYPGFNYEEIAPENVLTLDATNGIDAASLRQAFDAAQKRQGADLIVVTTSDASTPVVFAKESDALSIDDPSPVALAVVGTQKLTLDGASKTRLLTTSARSDVALGGLVFTGGFSTAGGAIYNSGTLTLDRVWITGNYSSGSGGGVYNESALTVVNSIISGNRAREHGGGVFSTGSYSEIGGVKIQTFVNDTITGNVAGYESEFGFGGGVYFQGVDESFNIFAVARFYNSIVVQNLSSATQCDVNIYNSLFYNKIEFFDEILTFEEAIPGLIDGDYNLTSFVYWESYYDVDDEAYVGTNQIYNASFPLFIADYDFEGETEGDYALYEHVASQAIDRGGKNVASYPNAEAATRDFAGNARVQNGVPDVGAYETRSEKTDMVVAAVGNASVSVAPIGATFQIDGITVRNVGSCACVESTIRFYASDDETFDESDVLLGEKTLGTLASQETRVFSSDKLTSDSLEAGKKYFFFCRLDTESDADDSNNTLRTSDSVYFFVENASDFENWNFTRETYEVSQGCAFFTEVVSEIETRTLENLSFWFDYGDGVYRQGEKSGWIRPSQYEGTPGVYALNVKIVDDELGRVVGKADANLNVKKTYPAVSVDAQRLGNSPVLLLNLQVFSANGAPVDQWEIDWGDGTSSTFESLGFSLTSAHRYAEKAPDAPYSVTLKLRDAETPEGIVYSIARFDVSDDSDLDADASINATPVFFEPSLPQATIFTASNSPVAEVPFVVQKERNVFEELCETNWDDDQSL